MIVINGAVSARINGASPTSGTYDNAPTLTGDATEADVAAGKTVYSNDPAIKRTGTYTPPTS